MPKKASVADLQQMFDGTLSIHKNKPYYIHKVNNGFIARCTNLITQREELLPIHEENFGAPTQRLGYVNVHGNVVYCLRTPIRRYKAGLSNENFVVKSFHGKYDTSGAHAKAHVSGMMSIELADCVLGKYPTVPEAYKRIREGGVFAVAFDRQFAMTRENEVFYKGKRVGEYKNNPKGIQDITFDAEFTYLNTLLDGNYEKALSAPRSQ